MKEIFFNGYELIQVFGFLIFFIIGYLIYALDETSGRDRLSIRTPKKFSFKFWFGDNWRRYLVTILTTYIFFRFYIEFTGHPLSYFECVMIGMIGDGIGKKIKTKVKFTQANRTKLLLNEDPDNIIR